MKKTLKNQKSQRKGVIAVFVALLIIPMMAMVVFAIDYGYMHVKQSHLQKAADASVLAAVRDLVPNDYGYQNYYATRSTARNYAATNNQDVQNFHVHYHEIEIGKYDHAHIYSSVNIGSEGIADTVRVKLRRDSSANSPLSLFFAPVLGYDTANISVKSAAILQKGKYLKPGNAVLPFAVPENVWDSRYMGEVWSIYGDGKVKNAYGDDIPGNWGTVDIGPESNGTSQLNDQILNGLSQNDLNALNNDGRIPSNEHIDSSEPAWLSADTGLSSGLKNSVQQIHGQTRIVPIYDSLNGDFSNGENLEFHIVKWGVVEVVDSSWNGAKNTHLKIKKTYTYDATIEPQKDLSNTTGTIEGLFTVPALVQ